MGIAFNIFQICFNVFVIAYVLKIIIDRKKSK